MNDGEKIGGNFCGWAVNIVVENHDFSTVLLDHPFNKLESESWLW
jgi:hypothetical protein